jgi:hypothetical protein
LVTRREHIALHDEVKTMLNAIRGTALCLALILAALPLPAADGRITAALGTGSTEDLQVVNPASEFGRDTAKVVCVWKAEGVTPGSHIRGIWIAEDTGGAAPPNYKIDEATAIAKTAHDRFNSGGTFTVSRPTKGWPAGRYRLEIYLENELARTVRFAIQGELAPVPPPKITAAELGTDRTADHRLLNPGTVFPADTPKIVCSWKSENIEKGTAIRALWVAEDAGGGGTPERVDRRRIVNRRCVFRPRRTDRIVLPGAAG